MAISFQLQQDEGGEIEGLTSSEHSKTLRYFAHCTESESHAQVRVAARQNLPVKYYDLIRTSIQVPRRIDFDSIFEVILEFKHPGEKAGQPPTIVDDTKVTLRAGGGSGGSMTFSSEAVLLSPAKKPVEIKESSKRVIGFDETGTINGVDVDGTSIELIVETVKRGEDVTARYLLNAAMARGKVNNFPYKGFPRGTLRLVSFDAVEQTDPGAQVQDGIEIGPSGETTYTSNPNWSLTFTFDLKPNVRGKLKMVDYDGEESDVPYFKEGHWHLDAFFTKSEMETLIDPKDPATTEDDVKFFAPVMRWAKLHRIHDYEDFETLLGI